jgi:hypothetical protein
LREINKLSVLVTLDETLNLYQPVSLEEMNTISFIKRNDIKFVFHSSKLIPILQAINERYRLLKIDKKRMEADQIREVLNPEETRFILSFVNIDTSILKPTVQTQFERFTLVNSENRERITIDTNLAFEGFSKKIEYPDLVICEQKLGQFYSSNYFVNLLKTHKIYPLNISKYCLGMVTLNPSVKHNRFKNKILIINKLSNDSRYYNIAG